MAYFPIFINVENVKVLVIGLGCIAARRINVLKNFGAEITVITKEVKTNVENIDIKIKEFEEDDIKEIYDIVIAATDNNAVNKKQPVKNLISCFFILQQYPTSRAHPIFYLSNLIINMHLLLSLIFTLISVH